MTLLTDLRFALRSLSRVKGLALTVIVTLALGIGANAAIFSVVRGVLLKPLANRDENRLIYIRQSARGIGAENANFSVPEIRDLKGRVKTLSAFGDFSQIAFTMVGLGEPRETEIDKAHVVDLAIRTEPSPLDPVHTEEKVGGRELMLPRSHHQPIGMGNCPIDRRGPLDTTGTGHDLLWCSRRLVPGFPLPQSLPAGGRDFRGAQDTHGKAELHQTCAMLRGNVIRMRRIGELPQGGQLRRGTK